MIHGMVTGVTGKDEMHEKTENLKKMRGMEFDIEFLSAMQMHHQQAIDMSRIAVKNAESSEVKKMARNIIKQQEKEVKDMEQMKQDRE